MDPVKGSYLCDMHQRFSLSFIESFREVISRLKDNKNNHEIFMYNIKDRIKNVL